MKIAILTPFKQEEAETFIQNHIQQLPFEKVVIYGGSFPYQSDRHKPSLLKKIAFRINNKFRVILGKIALSPQAYFLKNILLKEKVDVVFAEYLVTAAETLEICKQLDIPITAIALGFDISIHDTIRKYEKKYRALFQYAKYIFVVSEHMKDNLLTLACPEKKIIFTPAGPDKVFFDIKPSFNKKQILAVGRFVDKKAPHLTILAFKIVLRTIPDALLVIAGDGPLLNICKDLVQTYNLQNSVNFIGRITREQHQQVLAESSLFVQHSKTAESGDSEGTPVAILEASAAGLPVVSTIHAGIPAVIIDGKTGFLVAENDIHSMAERMIDLIENPAMAKTFGHNGRNFVNNNFSLEKHIEVLTKYISKANIKIEINL